MSPNKKLAIINASALVAFAADRILKIIFIQNPNQTWDFVFGVSSFHFAKNYGIAFSLLSNLRPGAVWPILIAIIFAIIFILVKYLVDAYRQLNILNILAFTLILDGAVSNLIDRLKYGFVVDYIDISFFTIFNIADCLITIGVIIIIISEFILRPKKITP